MYCTKCGTQIPDDSKFCKKCGNPTEQNSTRFIVLTCPDCGGTMSLSKDAQVVACPYCGSARLIDENDDVKIERIRYQADVRKEELKSEQIVKKTKNDNLSLTLIIAGFFILMIIFLLVVPK